MAKALDFIELKSVKKVARLSEETECFSAFIYVNGKKLGEASNRGQGGCNSYYFATPEARATFEDAVKKWAAVTPDVHEIEQDDQLVSAALAEFDERKIAVKNAKAGFPVTLKGKKGYEMLYVGLKDASMAQACAARHKVESWEIL